MNALRAVVKENTLTIDKLNKAIIARMKYLISKVPIAKMSEVLEFNVRVDKAIKSKSIRDMEQIYSDIMNYRVN